MTRSFLVRPIAAETSDPPGSRRVLISPAADVRDVLGGVDARLADSVLDAVADLLVRLVRDEVVDDQESYVVEGPSA